MPYYDEEPRKYKWIVDLLEARANEVESISSSEIIDLINGHEADVFEEITVDEVTEDDYIEFFRHRTHTLTGFKYPIHKLYERHGKKLVSIVGMSRRVVEATLQLKSDKDPKNKDNPTRRYYRLVRSWHSGPDPDPYNF